MDAAWIGLLGVVVGGIVASAWSWAAVIRQELSDGLVSARLVDDELRQFDDELRRLEELGRAGRGDPVLRRPDVHLWKENRSALARILGHRQWEQVSSAYSHATADHSAPLRPDVADQVRAARDALAPLVAGKRHVIWQRVGNLGKR